MKSNKNQKGFTLIELAIVLIVLGILIGLGAALLGPLTKQAAFKRSRERVKACKESIVGFVAASKRLPTQTEFQGICNEKDAWGIDLVYLPDDTSIKYDGTNDRADLTSGSVCCSALPSDMAVNDKAQSGGSNNYKKDVAFIVLSKGDDRTQNGSFTDNTNIGGGEIYSVYNIEEYSDTYDDIIEYVTVYELRDAINCEPLQILTNSFPDATEDSSYTVTLRATGGCQPYTWAASDCSGTASTMPTGLSLSGGAITGTPDLFGGPSGTLNSCSTTSAAFTISVTDNAGSCDERSFTLTVLPQQLKINTSSLPDGTVDMPYSANIIGSGGDISSYSYTVSGLPGGITASTSSDCNGDSYNECSQLTGTPTGSCGDYPVSAQLSDGCTTTTKGYNIHLYKLISCSLSASDNGDGTVDITYSITNGPVNGIFSPQSGTCTSFSNSSGGTCTTGTLTGTTTFSLAIADSCGDSAKCETTVTPSSSGGGCSTPMSLSPASGTTFSATMGTAFSQTINVSGGQTPYTNTDCTNNCSSYGLTLSCGSSSAVISGTPTSAGSCTFSVGWQDSCSPANTISGTYTVNIAASCTPFSGWSSNLPDASNCQTYSGSITVIGGVSPYSWSLTSGSLPGGINFCTGNTSNTCNLTGTQVLDSPGTYNFTVQVQDSCTTPGPQTTSQSFSINVVDACYASGISVRNETGQDRCYWAEGDTFATRWRRNRTITINPNTTYYYIGNIVGLSCVRQCTTDYCTQKGYDSDGDCRTRMRPGVCQFQDR